MGTAVSESKTLVHERIKRYRLLIQLVSLEFFREFLKYSQPDWRSFFKKTLCSQPQFPGLQTKKKTPFVILN